MPKPKPLYQAHVEAGRLRTLRDAQNRGVLVATGFGKDSDIYFAITRHKFDYAVEPEKRYAASKKRPGVTYALHEITSLASGVRSDDPLTFVGYMNFLLDENTKEAEVMFTEIGDERYRGKGLGLLLYKTAINDLVENGYEVISDYVRSEQAEHVWQSIRRDNPDEVGVISRAHSVTDESFPSGVYQTRPVYYTVGEFIGRRPVHVRGHRRRV